MLSLENYLEKYIKKIIVQLEDDPMLKRVTLLDTIVIILCQTLRIYLTWENWVKIQKSKYTNMYLEKCALLYFKTNEVLAFDEVREVITWHILPWTGHIDI